MVALLFVSVPAFSAGCVFESQIGIQFSPASPVVVKESSNLEQAPQRVRGVTTRDGQVVRIDCSITIVYDVMEATGSAVLAQLDRVHLRTRPLPGRTPYELDCTGPLVLEIPVEASGVQASSTSASGEQVSLPVQAPVSFVPIAFGRRLWAEPRTQFAVVGWTPALSPGDYRIELVFGLPEARVMWEKAIYTASVSCGRSRYLQPILPLVSRMARVPAFRIQPSAEPTSFSVPHIIGANGTYSHATRTLSCDAKRHTQTLRVTRATRPNDAVR
jgi:hypothetical protein